MTEKKTLKEEDINALSEDELNKVSGGYSTGDACPCCENGRLVYDRNYGGYYCTLCSFSTFDPRSRE